MGKYRRRRVKLKAHDRGDDRHEKGAALTRKEARLRFERTRAKAQP